MDNAALFTRDICIYWHGVFMGFAILLAIFVALLFCITFYKGRASGLLSTILLAIPMGIIFARVLYCVSNYEEFKTLRDILSLTDGGYALYGGILGVFLAAVVTHAFNSDCSISANCDCMAVGGAFGIAVGRMASYFSYDNVGIVMTDEKYCFFPLAVYDYDSGQWLLATFTMEAVIELIIFIVLWAAFAGNNNERKKIRGKSGDIALLFLMMHGASEAVFDSMHMDALRLPGNSFIRFQQVIGAICFAVVLIVFLVRSVKISGKFKLYHFALTTVAAGMIVAALCIELNRISDLNYFRSHALMFAALLCGVVICMLMYKTTLGKSRARQI